MSPTQIEELVRRIREGDEAAESELVETYGKPVALLLDRQTGGRPEAEDLFQETFRLAIAKLRDGELREPAKLPGFLSRMARNLAIEHYRKKARRKTEPDDEAVGRAPATGLQSQLGGLLAAEHAELVRRLLGELRSDRDREVLVRFYIAEEDREIIAHDLGLDPLTFNQVLCRARKRYKEIWLSRVGVDGALVAALLLILCAQAARRGGRR